MRTQHLGNVTIEHNHSVIQLADATWHAYPIGREHYNVDGNNGYIEGTVISGGYESRLFHSTSYRALPVGSKHRQDYCPITRVHNGFISCVSF